MGLMRPKLPTLVRRYKLTELLKLLIYESARMRAAESPHWTKVGVLCLWSTN
jgi:hypothetical protein